MDIIFKFSHKGSYIILKDCTSIIMPTTHIPFNKMELLRENIIGSEESSIFPIKGSNEILWLSVEMCNTHHKQVAI